MRPAALMLLAAAYFIGHTATRPAGQSFLDYRLLRNANITLPPR